jgi:hypothetical protein
MLNSSLAKARTFFGLCKFMVTEGWDIYIYLQKYSLYAQSTKARERFIARICANHDESFRVNAVYDSLKANPVNESSLQPYLYNGEYDLFYQGVGL